jgi:5'-nucleotidase (lipoprotein e(P4) family)
MNARTLGYGLMGLVILRQGLSFGWSQEVAAPAKPAAPPAVAADAPPPDLPRGPSESPPFRGLDANLYMQTSAEYRACCLQAYAWAKRLVNAKLRQRLAASEKNSAGKATEPGGFDGPKPPAVILDLDETVLDNRAFQSRQVREGWAYSQAYWSEFEENGGAEVMAIPGAIAFIQHLRAMGVQPIYITNRNARAQSATMQILERLKIAVPDEWLLAADAETKSSKDSRRAKVRQQWDVLLLVGDNLRDFADSFRLDGTKAAGQAIDERKRLVDRHQARFGVDWVLLPNPAYGEWTKALGQGIEDARLLEPRQP